MKNIIISTILISFLLPVLAFGQENSGLPKPGLTPDSSFYFLDIVSEKINLFFTFNPVRKIQKSLSYAAERLAEMKIMASKNKYEAVETAITGYEEKLNIASEQVNRIKEDERANDALTSISENTIAHQEVLADVYNKVPEEAKTVIEKAIKISLKNHEHALQQIAESKSKVEELKKRIVELEKKIEDDGPVNSGEGIGAIQKGIEILKATPETKIPVPIYTAEPKIKLTNTEIIKKIKLAVVYIETSSGSGSGVVIEENGFILTNAHVVQDVDSVKVKLGDARSFVGSVVGRDENIDLALLKISAGELPTVEFGNSDENFLRQGDEVFALGYPFGLEGDVSFKEGTISRRQTFGGVTYLETSAETYPGNSGGPLVNRFGEVIGINTLGVGIGVEGILLGESIKLAIPINTVESYVPELKAGRNIIKPKPTAPPEQLEEQSKIEEEARNAEIQKRSNKIIELLNLFNQLEQNYKDPLDKAEELYAKDPLTYGLYLELLLKEYATKRLVVIDQLIPEIRTALLIPNLPYQFTMTWNQFLDVLTLKRDNIINFLYR